MSNDPSPPEWLDRLVMDEALSALDGDTRRLLEEHAAVDPRTAALREEMRDVVALARAAAGDLPAEVPSGRGTAHTGRETLRRLRPLMAAAASAAIGLGLGILLGQRVAVTEPVRAVAVQPAPAGVRPVASRAAPPERESWDPGAWYLKARAERRHPAAWSDHRAMHGAPFKQWRKTQ